MQDKLGIVVIPNGTSDDIFNMLHPRGYQTCRGTDMIIRNKT